MDPLDYLDLGSIMSEDHPCSRDSQALPLEYEFHTLVALPSSKVIRLFR